MKHVEFAHEMAMELGYASVTILLCISAKQKAKQKDEKTRTKVRNLTVDTSHSVWYNVDNLILSITE